MVKYDEKKSDTFQWPSTYWKKPPLSATKLPSGASESEEDTHENVETASQHDERTEPCGHVCEIWLEWC